MDKPTPESPVSELFLASGEKVVEAQHIAEDAAMAEAPTDAKADAAEAAQSSETVHVESAGGVASKAVKRSRSPHERDAPSSRKSPRRAEARSRSSHSRSRRHRSRSRRDYSDRRYDDNDDDYRHKNSSRYEPRSPSPEVDESERDLRTVFAMQLSARLRRSDLVGFFSQAGRVRDAHIVADKGSRRSRGVAYVEFYTIDSAIKAVDLSGKRLLDVPIIVQPSEAEKNRQATMKQYSVDGAPLSASEKPSTTLVFVRELAVDIESGDLKAFFDLFGKVEYCHVEPLPGSRAEWSAFVKYDAVSSARHAADKMNGLPLFGARLRVRLARRAEEDSEIRRADEERAARKAEEEREARRNSEKALPPPATTAPPAAAVLCLRNAFGPEDQVGDDWRLAVAGRVRSACEAHGAVEEIRTVAGPDAAVFVRYTAGPAAEAACRALNARALGGHTLSASLASMEQFNQISA